MDHAIVTPRLHLRPLSPPDADDLHRLWTRREVRRYLWDGQVVAPGRTGEILRANTRLFEERGFGLWALRPRDTEDLIGFAGYWFFRDAPEVELVIGLAPERWGQGLATEAGSALIAHAFERLGFQEVVASTDAPNAASIRLMERLGMTFVKQAVVSGLDTVFYRIRSPYRIREPTAFG